MTEFHILETAQPSISELSRVVTLFSKGNKAMGTIPVLHTARA